LRALTNARQVIFSITTFKPLRGIMKNSLKLSIVNDWEANPKEMVSSSKQQGI